MTKGTRAIISGVVSNVALADVRGEGALVELASHSAVCLGQITDCGQGTRGGSVPHARRNCEVLLSKLGSG